MHILIVADNLYSDDFDISASGSHGQDGQDGGGGGDIGDGYTPEDQGKYGKLPEFISGLLYYIGYAVMYSFPLKLVCSSILILEGLVIYIQIV